MRQAEQASLSPSSKRVSRSGTQFVSSPTTSLSDAAILSWGCVRGESPRCVLYYNIYSGFGGIGQPSHHTAERGREAPLRLMRMRPRLLAALAPLLSLLLADAFTFASSARVLAFRRCEKDEKLQRDMKALQDRVVLSEARRVRELKEIWRGFYATLMIVAANVRGHKEEHESIFILLEEKNSFESRARESSSDDALMGTRTRKENNCRPAVFSVDVADWFNQLLRTLRIIVYEICVWLSSFFHWLSASCKASDD